MKRIKCVVIDDDQSAIEVLRRMIREIPELIPAGFTTNPDKGLEMIKTLNVQLAFVDLHMPELSGLDLIRAVGDKVQVICCSGDPNYGPQLSELDVSYYLQKPISKEKFHLAVARALERLNFGEWAGKGYAIPKYDPEEQIPFKEKVSGLLVLIPLCEIDYIQGNDKTALVFHHAGEVTEVFSTLRDIEILLPSDYFIRVHRSFLLAKGRIWKYDKVASKLILLKSCKPTEQIPIGTNYEAAVREFFADKIKRRVNGF